MAFSVRISTLDRAENHYSNREVDELDEQKVNFKSQPNKEKSYLCILPVVSKMEDLTRPNTKTEGFNKLGGVKVNRNAKMNKREYS